MRCRSISQPVLMLIRRESSAGCIAAPAAAAFRLRSLLRPTYTEAKRADSVTRMTCMG